MPTNENKRIVYIWPENKEFYDSLPNKSDVINRHLLALQNEVDPNQMSIMEKLRQIDEHANTQ